MTDIDFEKEGRQISNKVQCAYLDVIYGGFGDKMSLRMECHNLLCGPMHGCCFYEEGKCDYRSQEAKPELTYNPDGWLDE